MFIGHYAVGFASKKLAPKTSLGWLLLAALWADIAWPVFLMMGIERATIEPGNTKVTPMNLEFYPYSHSLVALCLWGLLLGGLYFLLRKDLRAGVVIFLGVISHWVLDFATHRPDMPITLAGTDRYGLGLWNYPIATFVVETAMFVASLWIYFRCTRATTTRGRYGIYVYAAFQFAFFCVNIFAGIVPPDIHSVAIGVFFLLPFIPLAHWLDKGREPYPAYAG